MSIGKEEDDRAFRVMLLDFAHEYVRRGTHPPYFSHEHRASMRFAFDAGMKRGEEKRGCCEERHEV